jgi:hypothetical protein
MLKTGGDGKSFGKYIGWVNAALFAHFPCVES